MTSYERDDKLAISRGWEPIPCYVRGFSAHNYRKGANELLIYCVHSKGLWRRIGRFGDSKKSDKIYPDLLSALDEDGGVNFYKENYRARLSIS